MELCAEAVYTAVAREPASLSAIASAGRPSAAVRPHWSQGTVNEQRTLYVDFYPRRAPWQPAATRLDLRLLGLAIGLLLLVAAAGMLYLSQASAIAELRYRLLDNERVQRELGEQIVELRVQVAMAQSLDNLENRVAGLGLVDASPTDPVAFCYLATPAAPGPSRGWSLAAAANQVPLALKRLLARVLEP